MGSPDSRRVACHLVVHGRVQGVFFRSSTREVAQRHAVAGWVRNVPDGTVEAWLEGDPGAVDAVVAWVRAGGPSGAEVHDLVVADQEPAGHTRFEVRG